MNFNWTDAQNALDILDHIWIGLVLVAVTVIPSWFAARNHKAIQDVKSNVVNGHTTPMRADLDKALAAIEELSHEVRGIRMDLMTEEDRRRRDVAELETRIGRHRKQED